MTIPASRTSSRARTCARTRTSPASALFAALVALFSAFALVCGLAAAPAARADDGASADTAGAAAPTPVAGPVPNIIITNFTYGDGSVPVGGDFTLGFTFQNMGRVSVSNMVVTVDGGENFAIAGGTNTFYFDVLYAGYSLTQSVPMQAMQTAKSGAQPVRVSFKYEYVDNDARSSNTSDITVSVPVSQPDRFQLNDPVVPEDATVDTETTITMDYVNKGKGDIANVEASIEGDGIETTVKTQYVGNVASGANGSIGFAFTPTTPGEIAAKLHVNYEDSDGKAQSKEFPVTVNVAEPAPMPDDAAMTVDEAQPSTPWWVWALAALGVVSVIVVVVVVVRRRRKKAKAKAAAADDEDWDDWGKDVAAQADVASAPVPADAAATQVIADLPAAPGADGEKKAHARGGERS
ncbi:CARDB domain-containing protein [Bifidobacterium aesculapii]|uniref:CARDB domain-containing protein n=1 Tax=Bifidobacterium aesculapii TaxID=1329411 RepID=UPI0006E2F320|nr:CARDB domain-containing protein [Bifidobacterium aesculapii]